MESHIAIFELLPRLVCSLVRFQDFANLLMRSGYVVGEFLKSLHRCDSVASGKDRDVIGRFVRNLFFIEGQDVAVGLVRLNIPH
jgi:hypothetical protein